MHKLEYKMKIKQNYLLTEYKRIIKKLILFLLMIIMRKLIILHGNLFINVEKMG